MSVYLPVLVKDILGIVEESQVSRVSAYISGFYFVGWALGGLALGVMGDRIGRVRSLALSIGMYGLFTFLIAFATSWEMVMLFRFFCGFGVGGMLVINTTLLSETWPEKSRAIFIGILSIGFPIGIFSSGAVNFFVTSWRHGFMLGIIPLTVGIISMGLLEESEKWKASRSLTKGNKPNETILAHRADVINGSIIFGSMLIGLWAIFSWVPTWVQTLLSHADGQRERGLSMMLLGAGGLSGGFLSGWVSNSLGTRKAMLMCFSACFILSFLLFKLNTAFTTVTMIEIASLSFMFGISQGLLSAYNPLLFPVSIRATATGLCFNVGRFFTAAAVFFVGCAGDYVRRLWQFFICLLVGFPYRFIFHFILKTVRELISTG